MLLVCGYGRLFYVSWHCTQHTISNAGYNIRSQQYICASIQYLPSAYGRPPVLDPEFDHQHSPMFYLFHCSCEGLKLQLRIFKCRSHVYGRWCVVGMFAGWLWTPRSNVSTRHLHEVVCRTIGQSKQRKRTAASYDLILLGRSDVCTMYVSDSLYTTCAFVYFAFSCFYISGKIL